MMGMIIKIKKIIMRLLGRQNVYYINGSESLPPPLETEIEEQLILDIDKENVKQTLIEHNLRLVVYIAKRFDTENKRKIIKDFFESAFESYSLPYIKNQIP